MILCLTGSACRCQIRLFLLDMLLGNPDRLPCETLGWRGNPHNILYACSGARAGRMVAIDSAVQRRPPGALPVWVDKWVRSNCQWHRAGVATVHR